jgi:hypothetical protein
VFSVLSVPFSVGSVPGFYKESKLWAEDSRGLSMKSDSGQLSGVCSEAAPARAEAAEHGN